MPTRLEVSDALLGCPGVEIRRYLLAGQLVLVTEPSHQRVRCIEECGLSQHSRQVMLGVGIRRLDGVQLTSGPCRGRTCGTIIHLTSMSWRCCVTGLHALANWQRGRNGNLAAPGELIPQIRRGSQCNVVLLTDRLAHEVVVTG